ncbi:uncharacterized protein JCM10292_004488 [Rhodotorula paludigena]|uniref:uncharacterized protein n=1 Tax=Rhodotorula paludigena TaxID=86838 RepID=UPI003178E668
MASGLPVVSSKTLPAALALPPDALCPAALDLAVLSSPRSTPDAPATDGKVALYRTHASADLVWEWQPPPPPAPAPTGKFGLKGKAKAQPAGSIEHVVWNPTGDALAVLVAPPTSSPSAPSTLSLLSIHTGQPLLPPSTPLPSSSARPTSLTWQPLSYPSDPRLSPWALRLIARLPALPKVVKEGLPSAGAGNGPGAPGGGGIGGALGAGGPGMGGPGGGGGGGGVFGAKQAMLERERAKEAQRPLSMKDAAERFPTVPPPARTAEEVDELGDAKVRAAVDLGSATAEGQTVLCVGDDKGGVHLYLAGSVYLGSVTVAGPVRAITAIPSTSASTASFAIHCAPTPTSLAVQRLAVPLPPSLDTVLRQSTALRAHLEHAFEALQEARNHWDEARRIGKGWLQRIADLSRPNGVTAPPITQLHLLLVTGRPLAGVHEFLASKMNERALAKWEQAMALALERLRVACWMSVGAACERVVVMLREVYAWARWPEKFADYRFARDDVLRATELAKETIRSAARLQCEVEEEERCFKQFCAWVHYELEKVAQQEGSDHRPNAAFSPLPVSHYIRNCLPPTATGISSFLSFGLASAPLAQSADLAQAEAWVAQLPVGERTLIDEELGLPRATSAGGDAAVLDATLKRMAEEVKGQADADELEQASAAADPLSPNAATRLPFATVALNETATAGDSSFDPPPHSASFADTSSADPDAAARRPPALSSPSKSSAARPSAPKSLPALLHLCARLVGGAMDAAVRATTGDKAVLGAVKARSEVLDEADRFTRAKIVGADGQESLCEVWLEERSVAFARQPMVEDVSAIEMARYKLETPDGAALRLVGFDFFGSSEVGFGFQTGEPEGAAAKYLVGTVNLEAMQWSSTDARATSPIPLSRQFALDAHYPPSAFAFRTDTLGRQRVATLGGEGRRLEVLDAGVSTVAAAGHDVNAMQS